MLMHRSILLRWLSIFMGDINETSISSYPCSFTSSNFGKSWCDTTSFPRVSVVNMRLALNVAVNGKPSLTRSIFHLFFKKNAVKKLLVTRSMCRTHCMCEKNVKKGIDRKTFLRRGFVLKGGGGVTPSWFTYAFENLEMGRITRTTFQKYNLQPETRYPGLKCFIKIVTRLCICRVKLLFTRDFYQNTWQLNRYHLLKTATSYPREANPYPWQNSAN